jgi:hypothetical protein
MLTALLRDGGRNISPHLLEKNFIIPSTMLETSPNSFSPERRLKDGRVTAELEEVK